MDLQFLDMVVIYLVKRKGRNKHLHFLLAVDQAVSILLKEKPKSKERISGSPAKSKVIPAFGQTDWEKNLSSK